MKFPWLRKQRDAELDAEIRSHLDEAIRDRIERGESPEQARAHALREFGNVGLVKEVTREMWGWASLERLTQDLRFGLRMLRKNPGFSLIAILTLALGIGANTLIFSVVNALLLRPLPYRNAERIVAVSELVNDGSLTPVSPANWQDLRAQQTVFESSAAVEFDAFNLAGAQQPEHVSGAWASAELFRVLQVDAALGRALLPEDERPESARAVLLSHGLWQRRFGGDANLIGKQVNLYGIDNPQEGGSYTVVGVLPQNFWFASQQFDVWVPRRFTAAQLANRGARSQQVIARLKPAVTMAQAQAELQAIGRRLAEAYPTENRQRSFSVMSLQERLLGEFGAAMFLLLGAVCFVLLIACANVANLLLARAAVRQKEISIRAALGASRFRIVRQLLTESVLLAGLGGLGGVLLAGWGLQLVVALIPAAAQSFIPGGAATIRIDWRVLAFTLGVAMLIGILFGLVPALAATKPRLNELLKDSAIAQSSQRQRLRSLFVIAEVALALVLLISAGLMVKSLVRLQQAELGFNPERILKIEIPLSSGRYVEARQKTVFYDQMLERVNTLPSIEAATFTNNLPLRAPNRTLFTIEGRPQPARDNLPAAADFVVSPQYFKAIGVTLRAGRPFDARDNAVAPAVGIISETAARQFWPHENPLGKRIRLGGLESQAAWLEIVGVVPDVKQELSAEPDYPALYRPLSQAPQNFGWLLARTTAEPLQSVAAIRQAIAALDQEQPLVGIATLQQFVAEAAWGQRFFTRLMGLFGALALGLAVMGIYGVIAYTVTQRTNEIGIRIALGAQSADILRLILTQGLKLILIGAALGLAGALGVTQLLAGLLFGISASDPLTFASVAGALIAVALLACWVPARRATKVDPLTALRHE
ncbi:MAG: ADOP family duplicated permease [Blastocatellia bacterium]